jgi:hypothetical protein
MVDNTPVTYRVRAYNDKGMGAYSDEVVVPWYH